MVMRPRARFSAEGKFGVPASIGLRYHTGVLVGAGIRTHRLADLRCLFGWNGVRE